MTWTLEVASNAAASSWTDVTDVVDRTSVRMGGQVGPSAGTSYGFDLDDDAAAVSMPSRRVARMTIGSTVVGRGRVVSSGVSRGTMFHGDARAFDVEVADANGHLQGIIVDGWERPAETDVDRMIALADDFLSGSPRASTDLAQTYIDSGNTIMLEAKRYDADNPLGVVEDLCRASGKIAFITADDEIFYDVDTSTVYAAGLSVTDVTPNLSTEFPPDSPTGTYDGSEFLSGAIGKYGTADPPASITDTRSTPEAAHDHWREVLYLAGGTSGTATRELTGILNNQSRDEERFDFGLKLTEAQIDLVKYGMTASFRSAACAVTTPRTIRIARIEYEELGDEIWMLHCQGGFPDKLVRRITKVPRDNSPPGSGGGGTSGPCCPPWDGTGTPENGAQVLFLYVADGDGSTTAWAAPFPYKPGTLRVYYNSKNVTGTKTEDDPTTGDFSEAVAPTASPLQKVYISFHADT